VLIILAPLDCWRRGGFADGMEGHNLIERAIAYGGRDNVNVSVAVADAAP
jgi:hypothetical protein